MSKSDMQEKDYTFPFAAITDWFRFLVRARLINARPMAIAFSLSPRGSEANLVLVDVRVRFGSLQQYAKWPF